MAGENGQRSSFLWVYGLVIVLAVLAAGVGSRLVESGSTSHQPNVEGLGWGLLALAGLCLVGALVALPIAMSVDAARDQHAEQHKKLAAFVNDRFQQLQAQINLVTENQLLSDRAKTVAFREKDRDAIRRAVADEIGRQDWEAALALANDMERLFGYRQEAERVRQEIIAKRHEVMQVQISDELAIVDRYTMAESWGPALQEAQRIMALYPGDDKIQSLPSEIEARRQARKQQLMDEWNQAVRNHDVDGSIEILKHLDLYLTPAEAEGMQETARGVFKEKISLLRAQFAMAVQDHRWAEAIRLGDTIMTEFPNSRMAQEVRDMMEMLRQRATDGNVAKV